MVPFWSPRKKMASIQKRNDSYRVRVKHQGQFIESKTFRSRNEAQQWGMQIEAKLRLGLYFGSDTTSKPNNEVLFEAAATHYMRTHSIHKRIVRCETSRLQILIKRWGKLPLCRVNKSSVISLRDDLLKLGRSGETINHYFNTLSKLFQMLNDEWDMDIPNPIKGIKRMPSSPGRTKRININLESILISSCKQLSLHLLSSIIQFAIQTGMRRGEIMSLSWADIDLPNRKAYLHQTKNGEPRQVPLTRQAMAILEGLSRNEERYFQWEWMPYAVNLGALRPMQKPNGLGLE